MKERSSILSSRLILCFLFYSFVRYPFDLFSRSFTLVFRLLAILPPTRLRPTCKSFCFCCCWPVRMGRTISSSSSVRKMTTAARRFTFSFFLFYPLLFHSSQSSLNVQKFSLTSFRGRNATVFVLLTNERNQRELSFSLVCFLFRIMFILVRSQANGLAVHRNRNVGNHGVENRAASLLEVSRWWNEKICDGFSLARSFASRPLLVPFSL